MATRKKTAKRPGRPPTTGIGQNIGVRCHPPLLKRIDEWAAGQDDKPPRSDAMRRLIERGLRND